MVARAYQKGFFYDLTQRVQRQVTSEGVRDGLVMVNTFSSRNGSIRSDRKEGRYLFVNEFEPELMVDFEQHLHNQVASSYPLGLERVLGIPYLLNGSTIHSLRSTPWQVEMAVKDGALVKGKYQSIILVAEQELDPEETPLVFSWYRFAPHRHEIQFQTEDRRGNGTHLEDLTTRAEAVVLESGVRNGALHLQDRHTTTGLCVMLEKYATTVLSALNGWVQEGTYRHDNIALRRRHYPACPDGEPPNAKAHLRAFRLPNDITIPIRKGVMELERRRIFYADFDSPVSPEREHKPDARVVLAFVIPNGNR